MAPSLRVALVQNCATPDSAATVAGLARQIEEAARRGAGLIALPEACEFLHPGGAQAFRAHAQPLDRHPAAAALAQAARGAGAWLLVGSLSVRADAEQLANRTLLFAPDGTLRASYDKIHLFDANPEDRAKASLESDLYRRGARAVVADIGAAVLGLTICYDLRFPHLYRALARAGANVLAVPSAFMRVTGEAHWHTLLRARAIETGCFVIAPAQCGEPHAGRQSYGHSLVVNPWGEVLADAGTEPCVVTADLDLREVEVARRRIPSLSHEHGFTVERA